MFIKLESEPFAVLCAVDVVDVEEQETKLKELRTLRFFRLVHPKLARALSKN